jgi:NAD(P)-dependent dehydrogenase (short-subunit alcohol dehydrogenase family)
MARFDGKRILITGGTSGIGLATAKRIVEEGGEVAVTGMSQEHLDEAGKALPSGSLVLRNDASDPGDAKHLAEKVRDQMGVIDGLFLNAGYGKFRPVEENDTEFFDQMFNTNVRGPVLHMAQLKPLIAEGGSVLLTASVSPYLGQDQGSVYAATKGAIVAMTRSFASDLAPRKIRVNSIAPGPIDTNFVDGTGMSDEEKEQFAEQIRKMVPLGRLGTAEEVAAVATFLLSDDSTYVTSSEYFVDGGLAKR